MFPWTGTPVVPTLYTGASFSVTVASLDSADGANSAAARVRGLGLPAFTRLSPGKRQVYQAMVGPYASLDEAEQAQRRLGGMGYRGARLFVDESLRTNPRTEGRAVASQGNPAVALLGAPDRLSLVLELQSEPRQVRSSRPVESTLEIDAGPLAEPVQPQQWSAPDGVHLLHTVAIEALAAPGGLHYVRARVALPEFARANVRNEGSRVYVDLTWPLAEEDVRAPRRPAPASSRAADAGPQAAAQTASSEPRQQAEREASYRQAIEPLHQRVSEMRPFLLSAAQSGSVDVLAALDQTLAALESSLTQIDPPEAEAGQHQLLISATRVARRGLEPGFTGDRVDHIQKAVAMFDGAMAPPTIAGEALPQTGEHAEPR